MSQFAESVLEVLAQIPTGRVVTYGQLAALAGRVGAARQVGYILAALPEETSLPWYRVINARGEVSRRIDGSGIGEGFQRHLLEEEGVRFDRRGRVDLGRYRWNPSRLGDRTGSAPGRKP